MSPRRAPPAATRANAHANADANANEHANPNDHASRLELAVLLNGAGKRDEATDQLIHIIRKERTWNDEAARKQLVQFFEAWGPIDEATRQGRRKLSSVLFA